MGNEMEAKNGNQRRRRNGNRLSEISVSKKSNGVLLSLPHCARAHITAQRIAHRAFCYAARIGGARARRGGWQQGISKSGRQQRGIRRWRQKYGGEKPVSACLTLFFFTSCLASHTLWREQSRLEQIASRCTRNGINKASGLPCNRAAPAAPPLIGDALGIGIISRSW